jgi:hypothetical protein
MKAKGTIVSVVAALLVSACGGSSSGPAPVNNLPPPPSDEASGGLWYGTLTNDMNVVTEEFVALSADDGRVRLISVDSEVQFVGTINVVGTDFSGTMRAFADEGVNWLDGNHVVDSTIIGVVNEHDSITGSWENASGESGTFEFFYDVLNDKDSDAALLEAVWTGYDDMGNPNVTFTIDSNGTFSGQNSLGCTSSGQFNVIDPEYNLYEVQSLIESCGLAGSYTGFALLADIVTINDAFLVSIDDGARSILLGLEK